MMLSNSKTPFISDMFFSDTDGCLNSHATRYTGTVQLIQEEEG